MPDSGFADTGSVWSLLLNSQNCFLVCVQYMPDSGCADIGSVWSLLLNCVESVQSEQSELFPGLCAVYVRQWVCRHWICMESVAEVCRVYAV